jgi:hypothetical protein
MSGTKEGGKKCANTNKLKHGADFYKRIGSMGGKNSTCHAFAHGKVDPAIAGSIGGKKSKRRANNEA